MAFLIGLTGSIGMGKSTTAAMFAEQGAAVWDADSAVHRLYSRDGAAVGPVSDLCPAALKDGGIDRAELSRWVQADPDNLSRLENVVHPLVAADREAFLAGTSADVVVLDIPLLFEGGHADQMDLAVVVSAPAELQRERVLARPGMTPEKLDLILSRQMPDAEKRARADVVIGTETLESARRSVVNLMQDIRAGKHARSGSGH
ncbi:dephospho-CoA kinase [Frigidibacter sp. ROC022]|uniref:dephospho-CoA kinase n=1 Tax=Frigidibacter sp. ROC022 TaxID=2971796 RepID=UPI00215B0437|nr:dephospho-CoA kinase [Frigidibacter sp. ROC022]MCR8724476.1 dephospho-CoA kinase [Frigidibacter sp. ROC022]